MDKWEDTVMNQVEMARLLPEVFNGSLTMSEYDTKRREFLAIATPQAEISFKAGKDKGKQEGFDKVVEWINNNRTRIGRSGNNYVYLGLEWQAFLKERGK